jgi:hypothetical protein
MMKETENVEQFFSLYDTDEALRQRCLDAEASYPGSLEIREAVAEDVLLPIAAELGLPFTLKELRQYETRKKMEFARLNDPDADPRHYWLIGYGWSYDYEGASKDMEGGE